MSSTFVSGIYKAVLLSSLMFVYAASVGIPTIFGYVQAGTIVLDPSHGRPGALVTFWGVGWEVYYQYPGALPPCWIDGIPAKIDKHNVCEIVYSHHPGTRGEFEPEGTFTVADVPAGTYAVIVRMSTPYGILGVEQTFTVDGSATGTGGTGEDLTMVTSSTS
jgi:hypothetical protein